jgi:GT2 family glycosyltransferase
MEADTTIAACQPKIKAFYQRDYFEYAGAGGGQLDRFGFPFCRGRIFGELEKDTSQYNDTVPVFWATGACLFVRAGIFHQIGGLESAFFAHMEEIDICWRLQNYGYKIYYCGQSEVFHVGGGTLPKSNPRKTFLNFRNGLALLIKNLPVAGFYRTMLMRLILDWIAALKFLLTGQQADARAVLQAHGAVWQHRRYWWQKRQQWAPKKKTRLAGWYNGSIVWAFFIRRVKKYTDLIPPQN